jgi:hypothetical protein
MASVTRVTPARYPDREEAMTSDTKATIAGVGLATTIMAGLFVVNQPSTQVEQWFAAGQRACNDLPAEERISVYNILSGALLLEGQGLALFWESPGGILSQSAPKSKRQWWLAMRPVLDDVGTRGEYYAAIAASTRGCLQALSTDPTTVVNSYGKRVSVGVEDLPPPALNRLPVRRLRDAQAGTAQQHERGMSEWRNP